MIVVVILTLNYVSSQIRLASSILMFFSGMNITDKGLINIGTNLAKLQDLTYLKVNFGV